MLKMMTRFLLWGFNNEKSVWMQSLQSNFIQPLQLYSCQKILTALGETLTFQPLKNKQTKDAHWPGENTLQNGLCWTQCMVCNLDTLQSMSVHGCLQQPPWVVPSSSITELPGPWNIDLCFYFFNKPECIAYFEFWWLLNISSLLKRTYIRCSRQKTISYIIPQWEAKHWFTREA